LDGHQWDRIGKHEFRVKVYHGDLAKPQCWLELMIIYAFALSYPYLIAI
jgi:hypothetical protein